MKRLPTTLDDEWLEIAHGFEYVAECIRDAVDGDMETTRRLRAFIDDEHAGAMIRAAREYGLDVETLRRLMGEEGPSADTIGTN